ncbi:MAG: signal peptidase II [Elusimicrobia bacterium]|jgi:signal peptidase II|nr:signal peptidase II [Elusimicrobiota bacterium]MBR4633049.1 signal peptidase II [Elusimicrobiota bacterium]
MKKYLYFLLPLIYVALDHITKFLVIKNIPYQSFIKINDYFNLVNISNTGVAFSMFQDNNIFFIILVSFVILFVIYFLIKNKEELTKLQTHSLLLILAGGTGNLIDRLFRGAVVDFIDIGYKDVYRWPAFNVADSCVCIGVALFIISLLFFNKKAKV